jgi:hypothetical protein
MGTPDRPAVRDDGHVRQFGLKLLEVGVVRVMREAPCQLLAVLHEEVVDAMSARVQAVAVYVDSVRHVIRGSEESQT